MVDFEITVRTVNVTPDSGQSKVYGDADPVLTYTYTGLVEGDSFTGALERFSGENVGTTRIHKGTLSAGNNYYVDVNPYVDFTITAKPVVVTPDPGQSIVYGDNYPEITYTHTGLVGGDSFGGTLQIGVITKAGTYPITLGSLCLSSNYALTLAAETVYFEVAKKPVTVTPNPNQSKVYGSDDPLLTYTHTGLVSQDSFTGALDRAVGENVGSYAIGLGTLSAGDNYALNLAAEAVSFGITKKSVSVTPASEQSKVYGEDDPELTYSADGLVGEDKMTGSMARAPGKDVGSYAINLGTLSAGGNYDILFTGGISFTITEATVTVTPDPGQSKGYGDDDPVAFAYTSSGLVGSDTLSGKLAREAGEDVGTYGILQGSLSAGSNYNLVLTEATFEITRAFVTVTPDPGQSKIFGTPDPVLTYILSKDLPATGKLSRTGGEDVGEYTITLGDLSVGGNYEMKLSGSVPFSIKVSLKTLTVTTDIPSQVEYRGSPIEGNVTVKDGGTVLVPGTDYDVRYGDNVNAGTAKVYAVGKGTYAESGGYCTFTVTKKTATVNPGQGQHKSYGTADPVLGYTVAGLVGGDGMTGSLARDSGENVGIYAITLGTLSAGSNYDTVLDTAAVTFEITKATATVTPNPGQSKVYGTENPVLEYVVTGLVGSDSMTGNLSRASGENVGIYAITLGTLSAGSNYDTVLDTAAVTFEITKATATVTRTPDSPRYTERTNQV